MPRPTTNRPNDAGSKQNPTDLRSLPTAVMSQVGTGARHPFRGGCLPRPFDTCAPSATRGSRAIPTPGINLAPPSATSACKGRLPQPSTPPTSNWLGRGSRHGSDEFGQTQVIRLLHAPNSNRHSESVTQRVRPNTNNTKHREQDSQSIRMLFPMHQIPK
jgi:hypothetical protein